MSTQEYRHSSLKSLSMSSARQLYYKVTQIRSSIGMPPTTRRTLEALGLKRRNQTVYTKCDVSSAHSLAKVKELVKIEVTNEKKTREEINQERKWKSGFEVISEGTRKVYE